jgi:hypothetical protein
LLGELKAFLVRAKTPPIANQENVIKDAGTLDPKFFEERDEDSLVAEMLSHINSPGRLRVIEWVFRSEKK